MPEGQTRKIDTRRPRAATPPSPAAVAVLQALVQAPSRQAFQEHFEKHAARAYLDELLSGVSLDRQKSLAPGRLFRTGADRGRLLAVLLSLLTEAGDGSRGAEIRKSVQAIEGDVAWFPELRGFGALRTLSLHIDEFQEPRIPLRDSPGLEFLKLAGVYASGEFKGCYGGKLVSGFETLSDLDLPALLRFELYGINIGDDKSFRAPVLRTFRGGHSEVLNLTWLRGSAGTLETLDVQQCGKVVLPTGSARALRSIVFWRNGAIERRKWLEGSCALEYVRFETPGEGLVTVEVRAASGCTLSPTTIADFASRTRAKDLCWVSDEAAGKIGAMDLEDFIRLTSLEGIERFVRLKKLIVPRNAADLSPIARCPALVRLGGRSRSTRGPASWPATLKELPLQARFSRLGSLPPGCRVGTTTSTDRESDALSRDWLFDKSPESVAAGCKNPLKLSNFPDLEDLTDLGNFEPSDVDWVDLHGCVKVRSLAGLSHFKDLRGIRIPPTMADISALAGMQGLKVIFDPPITSLTLKDLHHEQVARLAATLSVMRDVSVTGFDYQEFAATGKLAITMDPDIAQTPIFSEQGGKVHRVAMTHWDGVRCSWLWRGDITREKFDDIAKVMARLYPAENWAAMVRKKEVDPRDDPADHQGKVGSSLVALFDAVSEPDRFQFFLRYMTALGYCKNDYAGVDGLVSLVLTGKLPGSSDAG